MNIIHFFLMVGAIGIIAWVGTAIYLHNHSAE